MRACNGVIAVIYLSWAGAAPQLIERFAASFAAHEAGVRHTLFVAWKGYLDPLAHAHARDSIAGLGPQEAVVSADGLDLSAYRQVAGSVAFDTLCFLNSSSVVLADGWLGHLASALAEPEIGIVGASASFESALSSAPRPLRLLRRGRFPAFPNPHLRSNAFMIERDLLLSLDWPRTESKHAAWALESGTQGITAQVRQRSLEARVVGSDGTAYLPDEWPRSATFRSGEQENLLVADNRTRQYAEADPTLRRRLRQMAWGDLAG
jgi:hypothetical protein